MVNEGEATANQDSREPAERSRKAPGNPNLNSMVDEGSQTRISNDDFIGSETWDEKKTGLLQELAELKRAEAFWEGHLEAVRKRKWELEVQIEFQEKRLQCFPTNGYASTVHSQSGTGFDNSTSSISQTTAGHYTEYNHNTLSRHSVGSTSSLESLASSCQPSMVETTSTDVVLGIPDLQYYKELDGNVIIESQLLKNMDLVDLRRLTVNEEEEAKSDTELNKCMGRVYYSIFLKTAVMEDLEHALDRTKKQIPIKVDNPRHAFRLKDLIVMLVNKYQHTNSQDDLQEAIFRAQEMVAATSLDHPDHSARMLDWIKMMFMKYNRTQSTDDLDEAKTTAQEAGVNFFTGISDGGDPTLKAQIPVSGKELPHDVNDAIGFTETAAAVCAHDKTGMGMFILEPGMPSLLGDIDDEDLPAFADFHKDATSDPQLELYICACFLVFTRTGSMNYLERAIRQAERWVAVISDDHQQRARRFKVFDMLSARMYFAENNLQAGIKGPSLARVNSATLHEVVTGNIKELNYAIEDARMLVKITQPDCPGHVEYFDYLGWLLYARFEQTGAMDDLDHAIEAGNTALKDVSLDNLYQPRVLSNLGNRLVSRFEWIGDMQDLDRAFEVTQQALEIFPSNDKNRPKCLINHARCFGARFEWSRNMDDINQAVEITEKALDAALCNPSDQTPCLLNIGLFLCRRFECAGAMEDIDRAIEYASVALDATTPEDRDRAMFLNNIGTFLGRRFERTKLREDLDRAIEFSDRAVKATLQDNPNQAIYLSSLGIWLEKRYEQTKARGDIDQSIKFTDMAINATSPSHLSRAVEFSNLGAFFYKRFEQEGAMEDLDRAIEAGRNAVEITSLDNFSRAGWLGNLGKYLRVRFLRTNVVRDFEQALSSFREGWNCNDAPPSIRLNLGKQAAQLLASQSDWEASSTYLRGSVQLLPAISPWSLRHTDKQEMLSKNDGLASDAAAVALNAGNDAYHALELLELGRGVIAGLLLDMRTDISALQKQYPKLAEEFSYHRDVLDSTTDQTVSLTSGQKRLSSESQAKRRREVEARFHEVIKEIHAQPGFGRFLLPPTEDELKAAADLGPIIVVNLSSYRCDAFLIKRDSIRVLELPNLTLRGVEKWARDLRLSRLEASFDIKGMLEWLWEVLGRPVLDALGFSKPISDDEWPHIWWIPTGLLSRLPLHAAGVHAHGSTETVLDRVMSSYVSSIKALIHGRRYHVCTPLEPLSDHALLVAMRETPGLPMNQSLPYAADEVEMLEDLCPLLQLKPIKPILRKADILHNLNACKIFHFAGHGHSDPDDPSKSCLLLEDWKSNPLTVGDLRDFRLQSNPPFLGYLSACSTGANEAYKLRDEGIHLISALQIAGFRHVIGTLWEVSDRYCVHVAKVLYETIRDKGMTDMAVCEGLHHAVRALRDGRIENLGKRRDALPLLDAEVEATDLTNYHWVPYILFGA